MPIDETLLKSDEKAAFALRELYSRFGYTQFKMSKFEEYDLYVKNKDFLVSDGIITFTDSDGRLLALKPDVTLSIINNSRDSVGVQKLYYNENVYRISGSTHTYKEIMQTGLECIGDIGLFEICEVLSLAVRSLETIDEDYALELSHIGLVEAAFDELCINASLKAKLLALISQKNRDDLAKECETNGLSTDTAAKLLIFTENYTDISSAIMAIEKAFKSSAVTSSVSELKKICEVLCELGTDKRITVDFSSVGCMSYYSGVVFKGYINGIPEAVLSGGQYDKLMKKMHRNAGAVGFAVYLDTLERFNNTKRDFDVDTVLLQCDDITAALKTSEQLSSDGSSVLVCKELPQNIRCRRVIKITEKGLTTVHAND